jgi:hypothetical protein
MGKHAAQRTRARPADRDERLAAALRANLKRRKAQARGRAKRPEDGETEEDQPNRTDSDTRGG